MYHCGAIHGWTDFSKITVCTNVHCNYRCPFSRLLLLRPTTLAFLWPKRGKKGSKMALECAKPIENPTGLLRGGVRGLSSKGLLKGIFLLTSL